MEHRQDFSLLINFTCAVAKDELEKHPEMRTIEMVELENNFPADFSAKVLKCLPQDVAKINLNPHSFVHYTPAIFLPKQTMVIYVADKVDYDKNVFQRFYFYFDLNFPVVSHLSKFLIVSRDDYEIKASYGTFEKLLNVAQIYEKNGKIIARSVVTTQNAKFLKLFEDLRNENASQVLFPDKTKNLNKVPIHASYFDATTAFRIQNYPKLVCKWTPFLDIIEEKLNVTVKFTEMKAKGASWEAFYKNLKKLIGKRIEEETLDFFLNYPSGKFDLESYSHVEWCLVAPLPEPYSITELILFLPMDKFCWMWLGLTIAVSTLIWRISEGHWNFAFGAFAYFMGQAQLIIRIRTNRLTMKIYLQLLIFTIFIFSNGYQSLVTSFMLNPMQQRILKSLDEVYDSNLKIESFNYIKKLQGDNPKYQKALQDGKIVNVKLPFDDESWPQFFIDNHLAFTQPCEHMNYRIKIDGDGKSWKGLYLISEAVYTFPTDLYTKPFHPYIEKFQELMDRTFESGLHQKWERFIWEFHSEDLIRKKRKRTRKQQESDVLDFGLIAPFFLILAVGFIAALLALFCEIFYHDFVSELTKNYFKRKFDEIFRREIKVTKVEAKPKKVKRIEVQPFDREVC